MITTLLYVYLSKKPTSGGLNTSFMVDFLIMAVVDFIINRKGAI